MFYETNEVAKDELNRSMSPPQPNRVGVYFEQLRGEILNVLANESFYHDRIQKLESELSVYKRAYADVDAERGRLEILKQEAEKQKVTLEKQLKGYRIVTLLDGDGAIFSGDLIAQGQAGGHAAAQMLSDSIIQYLSLTYGANQYQLWVHVFFNKRGLMETFGRVGNVTAKVKFEEFIAGFNQAAERFLMVDVGNAKEAADAKIKAHLEDDIRLPQTYKVIFGGCHDNGYVTNLRSQITAGFKHKLILLRSYTEMAAGIADLELPVLTIPDLFLTQKLNTTYVPNTPNIPPGLGLSPRVAPMQSGAPVTTPLVLPERDHPLSAPPESTLEADVTTSQHPSIPPSYSSAVQIVQRRPPTPDLDSSGSTTSDASEELPEHRPTPTRTRTRHVNPNIPLSKHKPPPCTLFYLANCKHGSECKYGHDYLLDAEHFAEIRLNAKKAPCPAINKGESCIWGDECCYGHYCSLLAKCHFFKQGRCKFLGVNMHKEPKSELNGEL